jgi:phage repressor protein C with HTH and peptisase S24 domain
MAESTKSDNDPLKRSQAAKVDSFMDRVREALGGKPVKWLSDATGISTSMLSDYGKGKTPGADKAALVARALGVTIDWLLTGETLADQVRNAYALGDDDIRNLLALDPSGDMDARILGLATSTVTENRPAFRGPSSLRPETVELNELDLAYGMGSTFIQDAPVKSRSRTFSAGWLRNFTDSPFDKLFFAKGIVDSMMPTILDNDIVLIDTAQITPRMWDQLWAVDMGGLGMIKRLRPGKDGAMRLISDNPAVPEEIAYDDEMHVIGRVAAIVRKT